MKRAFLILASAFLLSACSSGSASVTQSQADSKLPPEPDRIANNATLAGIDTTGTGVRDDVHRLIFQTYTSATKRTVAMSLAKATRKIYLNPPTTSSEARVIADGEHKITDCIYSLKYLTFKERSDIIEEMVAAHADTGARMETFLYYNSLLSGESFELKNIPGACAGILP